jgi:hypothetical protein
MNGPPLSKANFPNKPVLALSPLSLHQSGTWKLRWIAKFCLHVCKKAKGVQLRPQKGSLLTRELSMGAGAGSF